MRALAAAHVATAEAEQDVERVAFGHIDLASMVGADKKAPNEFRIFPAGVYKTTKGDYLFDEKASQRVMAKVAEWGNDYCVDYDHMMLAFLDANSPTNKESAAWYRPELRNGELWASKVEWIPEAGEKVASKKFRYISPAWRWEQDELTGAKRIVELINVGLTNLPATLHQKPLVASRAGEPSPPSPKEKSMNWKNLLAKLGLTETASEADAMAALERLLGPSTQLANLTSKTTPAEQLAVIQAWKNDAGRVAEMSSKLATIEQASKAKELEDLIAAGQKAGKLTEPMLAWAKTQTPEALKAYLDVAQPVVPVTVPRQPAAGAGNGAAASLTAEEIMVAKQMNISLEDFKKQKAKLAEEQA
jgi:phage I-like protein